MYKVVEIFQSIDGEGIRTGATVNFVRLAGCNLRCSYCDTLYSLFDEEEPCVYEEMDAEEIMKNLEPRFKRVTLTGGEPLIHKDVTALVNRIAQDGYEVNIETNGAVDISEFMRSVNFPERVFFTIDYKLPTSGMTHKMINENFFALRPQDVIKFVVGNHADISEMKRVMAKLLPHYKENMPVVYAGPVYGMMGYDKLVDVILKEPLFAEVRFQIQLHKVIWDPERRGV